jgi:hypothetical protein
MTLEDQARMFANRVEKNIRHLRKWAPGLVSGWPPVCGQGAPHLRD